MEKEKKQKLMKVYIVEQNIQLLHFILDLPFWGRTAKPFLPTLSSFELANYSSELQL